jgi:hypothetical protein
VSDFIPAPNEPWDLVAKAHAEEIAGAITGHGEELANALVDIGEGLHSYRGPLETRNGTAADALQRIAEALERIASHLEDS